MPPSLILAEAFACRTVVGQSAWGWFRALPNHNHLGFKRSSVRFPPTAVKLVRAIVDYQEATG